MGAITSSRRPFRALPNVVGDIGLQPRLSGRPAATLIDELPIGQSKIACAPGCRVCSIASTYGSFSPSQCGTL